MLSSVTVYLLFMLVYSSIANLSVSEEQESSIQLELIEWDVEAEACESQQTADWHFLLRDIQGYLDNKVEKTCESWNIKRKVAKEAKSYRDKSYRSVELSRRAELLATPGYPLLSDEDCKLLAQFSVEAELKQRAPLGVLAYGSQQENVQIADVPHLFANVRNASQLESLWLAWQRTQTPSNVENWRKFLAFVPEATKLNGFNSETEFWESQSDWKNGFYLASQLWKEIEPLYLKFHGFVRRRLETMYRNIPDNIPVYLLGSPLGHDWSYIADIILLDGKMYSQIQTSLKEKQLGGAQAYKEAESMVEILGLPNLGTYFYESSLFNVSCPPHLMASCADENVKVITCDAMTYQEWLGAYETTFRASQHVLTSEDNSYIFKHGERTSAITEAISSLGSLLATTQVVQSGLVLKDGSDLIGQQLNLRLLIALRVLPRLAALLATDLCRLREISFPSASPVSCWTTRRSMQRVSPPDVTDEPQDWWDLLADPAVTTNTPHLSEFAGLILQFQLLDYLADGVDIFSPNFIKKAVLDDKLSNIISTGLKQEWPTLLKQLNIEEIKSESLLNFFQPLVPIFDDMSPVPEIPDYEPLDELLSSIFTTATPIVSNETINNNNNSSSNSTMENIETSLPIDKSETKGHSNSTTFIAVAGLILGVSIVVASVFLVNKKRKKAKILRYGNNKYEAVMRHSAGRPASFSPVVAKRLSENGETPPVPNFSTFREIDLENNENST